VYRLWRRVLCVFSVVKTAMMYQYIAVEMSLSRTTVATGDIASVANYFVIACGSENSSVEFLEAVVNKIKSGKRSADNPLDEHQQKIARGCQSIDDTAMESRYENDSIDDAMATLAMHIPNDKLLISYIIGTGGATLNEIESKTGTKIRIERSQQGPVSHRMVFIVGTIKNVVHAFRHVSEVMGLKQTADIDHTIIEIPNDFVSRLIGRSGSVVKKVETDTGCRVFIQQEREMFASQEMVYGRVLTLKGAVGTRMVAIYHILRLVNNRHRNCTSLCLHNSYRHFFKIISDMQY
jgi:rRNA processing protein Krr1/Pno1